jgi:hypothetical protein
LIPAFSFGRERGRFVGAIVLITLAAAALRLAGINRSLSIDEAFAVWVAGAPDFWAAARVDVHPPFYYFVVHLVHAISPATVGLRLPSVAAGVALLAVAAVSFRRQPLAAILACAAVAVLPGFVVFSQQVRPYALLLLLHGVALALAARLFLGAAALPWKVLLGLVLIAAAAVHLVSVFVLVALLPLVLWPVRTAGPRAWIGAALPLLPAGLAAVAIKFFLITAPKDVSGGWWIPVDAASIFHAWRDAFGWSEIQWMADAWSRHAPGGPWAVILAAITAALFAAWTAWGRRTVDPLAWTLLAVSAIYTFCVCAYSIWFEPIVMVRTLLPAVLPFVAGLAHGIATHPDPTRRWMAAGAVLAYLAFTGVPVARLAVVPAPGLRELSATAASLARPGDLLITFRAMDYGLSVHGVPASNVSAVYVDQTTATPAQLASLQQQLRDLPRDRRVLVAYRDDFYLQNFPAALEQVLADISRERPPPAVAWRSPEFTLLLSKPTNEAP